MASYARNTELTSREKQALGFYKGHLEKFKAPPSYRQLAAYLGCWPNAARYLVLRLQEKGYLVEKKITAIRLTVSTKGKKA
jgi:hypothetical protein